MSNDDVFHKAVITELSAIQSLDTLMAEAVVYAGPSEDYLRECRSKGYTAKQTALGFEEFQEQYLIDLVSTVQITYTNNIYDVETDEIPFDP